MTLTLLKVAEADKDVRENFTRLEQYVRDEPLLRGNFEFFEFILAADTYPKDVRAYVRLGFVPKDILVTSAVGSAYTLKYAEFTPDYLLINLTGPVRLRAFVGTYSGEKI